MVGEAGHDAVIKPGPLKLPVEGGFTIDDRLEGSHPASFASAGSTDGGAAIAVKPTIDRVSGGTPGWQTAAASHATGLFFRGGQQPADAIGVRDDVMDGRDAREPGVCRHERLGSCGVGRCGQDRVERAEARSFLEQA